MSKTYLSITPFFPTPSSFRGPYVLDQVKALQRLSEYDVVVLKPKPWHSSVNDYEYEGIKVYHFKKYELPSNILPGLFDWLSKRSFFKKLIAIGIQMGDINIAHAHVTGQGLFANALKKRNPEVKTFLQHHGFDVLSTTNGVLRSIKPHKSWVERYGQRICNKIDCHVTVSKKTLDFLKEYKGLKINDSYILYNGVDTSKFHPLSDRKSTNDFTIGCIGNFWPLKDQMTLLRAVKRIKKQGINDFTVKLVGTGPELEKCKDFVIDHDLVNQVVFTSEIPHDELIHFYNSLDLFILPSYHEAFGCVYAEAYACGVPFIAVKDQGISELIPEEEREDWLIEKGDDQQLALLIINFIKNKSVLKLNKELNIDSLIKEFLSYTDNKL